MPEVYGDERRLKQVLINLIKNALESTDMGFIEICTSFEQNFTSGKMLLISVRDTGKGVD